MSPLPRFNVGRAQGYGRHGLTLDMIESMRRAQRGLCPICWRPLPAVPTVDHDHELAALHGHSVKVGCRRCVRALLCRDCNLVLGHARDDEALLRRAAAFLEEARRLAARVG